MTLCTPLQGEPIVRSRSNLVHVPRGRDVHFMAPTSQRKLPRWRTRLFFRVNYELSELVVDVKTVFLTGRIQKAEPWKWEYGLRNDSPPKAKNGIAGHKKRDLARVFLKLTQRSRFGPDNFENVRATNKARAARLETFCRVPEAWRLT